MTINLHRITMHVSIKNRLTAKWRYYVRVFRVPIRIIPRIRAIHAKNHAARVVRPAWLYLIFESRSKRIGTPPRNKNGHGSVVHAAFGCESWTPVTCTGWKCGISAFYSVCTFNRDLWLRIYWTWIFHEKIHRASTNINLDVINGSIRFHQFRSINFLHVTFYSAKYLKNAGKMLIKILHYDTNMIVVWY